MPIPSGRSGTRYHLNALFDLELGGYSTEKVKRFAAELSVLFLPLCRSGDAIVLDVGIPESYRTYLSERGLFADGQVAVLDKKTIGLTCGTVECWGWNTAAAEDAGAEMSRLHPSAAVVARVNGRQFCSDACTKYGSGVPGSRFFTDDNQFEWFLESREARFPLVVKPAFGSSGYGITILHNAAQSQMHRVQIESFLLHGGFVAEPWCERVHDVGSVAVINPDGSIDGVLMHRQLVNRYGAFFGVVIDHTDEVLAPVRDAVAAVTMQYSREAAAIGYSGPLGIDSFIYRTPEGGERLAAGIEINGRYTMGYLAHLIKRMIATDRCMMMRFTGKKRCRLPASYQELGDMLGENGYDPSGDRGIVLLTPLQAQYEGTWRQPQQNVFLIVAPDSASLEEIDRFLMSRLRSK